MPNGYPHTISSVAKKTKTYISHFGAVMFLSTIFSSTASIVALYGSRKDDTCRYGFLVAPVVLQAIAVAISLAALLIACGSFSFQISKNYRKSEDTNDRFFLPERPTIFGLLGGIVQLLSNITSLVLLVLILTQENGCNNLVLSNTNAIFGIALSAASAGVTAVSEKDLPRFHIESVDHKNHIYKIEPTSARKCIRFGPDNRFRVYLRPNQRNYPRLHFQRNK